RNGSYFAYSSESLPVRRSTRRSFEQKVYDHACEFVGLFGMDPVTRTCHDCNPRVWKKPSDVLQVLILDVVGFLAADEECRSIICPLALDGTRDVLIVGHDGVESHLPVVPFLLLVVGQVLHEELAHRPTTDFILEGLLHLIARLGR